MAIGVKTQGGSHLLGVLLAVLAPVVGGCSSGNARPVLRRGITPDSMAASLTSSGWFDKPVMYVPYFPAVAIPATGGAVGVAPSGSYDLYQNMGATQFLATDYLLEPVTGKTHLVAWRFLNSSPRSADELCDIFARSPRPPEGDSRP